MLDSSEATGRFGGSPPGRAVGHVAISEVRFEVVGFDVPRQGGQLALSVRRRCVEFGPLAFIVSTCPCV